MNKYFSKNSRKTYIFFVFLQIFVKKLQQFNEIKAGTLHPERNNLILD